MMVSFKEFIFSDLDDVSGTVGIIGIATLLYFATVIILGF